MQRYIRVCMFVGDDVAAAAASEEDFIRAFSYKQRFCQKR